MAVSGRRATRAGRSLLEVSVQGRDRVRAQRDAPFLVPLADAAGRARRQVEVAGTEPDDFRDAAAGRVQRLEGRTVAAA